VEVKKQYQLKIAHMFTALRNVDANMGMSVPCESIRDSIRTSAEEITEVSL
jgi:hypothetical protein